MASFSACPPEMLERICSFLNAEGLFAMGATCKEGKYAALVRCEENGVWERECGELWFSKHGIQKLQQWGKFALPLTRSFRSAAQTSAMCSEFVHTTARMPLSQHTDQRLTKEEVASWRETFLISQAEARRQEIADEDITRSVWLLEENDQFHLLQFYKLDGENTEHHRFAQCTVHFSSLTRFVRPWHQVGQGPSWYWIQRQQLKFGEWTAEGVARLSTDWKWVLAARKVVGPPHTFSMQAIPMHPPSLASQVALHAGKGTKRSKNLAAIYAAVLLARSQELGEEMRTKKQVLQPQGPYCWKKDQLQLVRETLQQKSY